jgi:hypothetical protein
MHAKELYKGNKRSVWGICKRDRPIYEEDLFSNISTETKEEIDVFIKILSDATLPIKDKRVSTKIKSYKKLFELKPYGIRLFYFFLGNDVYITSGCKKKNQKENRGDYKKADSIRQYFIREE